MIYHWPHLEHPLEYHGIEIPLLLDNDQINVPCQMEYHHTKQHRIILSHARTNLMPKHY